MKSRVSRMGCDSVLGENYNIKYHTGNLVASEPIQFRVEVLNQMIADYQRAKTYVPDVRNID